MEGEVLRVKRARLLSQKQIREIIMDSDSDEQKYYASSDTIKHWPGRNHTNAQCCVCSVRGVRRTVVFRCVKCDVAICVAQNCFEDYHKKDKL